MKMRKNISRFLAIGIILNNIYFNANANNMEIPNRYETLEGEHVIIDDSVEEELYNIEIFGNTVQDENNLEDIQSVGDLYVNENGEPILDNRDRKQYKIDINSTNTRGYYNTNNEYDNENIELVYGHGREHYFEENNIRIIYKSTSISRTDFDISGLKPNTNYRLTGELKLLTDNNEAIFNISNGSNVFRLQGGTKYAEVKITSSEQNVSLTAQSTSDGILKISFFNVYLTSSGASFNGEISLNNILLAKDAGDVNNINQIPLHNSSEIVLPFQLEGIKSEDFRHGYRDKLYYDNSKRRYVLEKGINEIVKNTSEIDESYFSESVMSAEGYYTLEIPINVFANDVKQYSVIMINNFDFGKNGDYKVFLHDNHHLHFFIPVKDLAEYTLECAISKWKEVIGDSFRMKYISTTPQIIETNIISKLNIPTFEEKTHIYSKYKNTVNPILKVTVDRLPQISRDAVGEAEVNSSSNNIALARLYVNMLPESLYKDQLQEQLNQLLSSDMVLDRKNITSNIDVYVKSENSLHMTLSTNNITFEDYSGVEELELQDVINISINSSLPYSLNAYIVGDIVNGDKSKTMDLDILNIKEGDEINYQKFDSINNKVVLKDNCVEGNGINHSIDLKLDGDNAHKADVYKTTIKFEAEQK